MEAERVWGVWRRLLREPAFEEAVFADDFPGREAELGLAPEEAEIALAYRETPKETRWFITNYRYRLVSSICYALETCAPWTWRLLQAKDLDMREVAAGFLDAHGWIDDGPFVYGTCARVLDHLRETLGDEIHGLRALIQLDSAGVELIRSLAGASPEICPSDDERAAAAADMSRFRYQRTGTGALLTVERTLTPWLRDREAIGKTELPARPQHFLVYLPNLTSAVKLAGIGPPGLALWPLLESPKSLDELAGEESLAAVGGPERYLPTLKRYLQAGVVRGTAMA